ncbi:DUF2213 domain-containing protein [Methylobacterium brachiatum]|uniref:DUF2213 domain-containing protein n=1 Tax=Methylobacterium brachiatum TaxID=269660 RepID=UPI000EFAC44F|nr:DUF2213 domain-containing protein [Methylobacterium brachiatum]AYO83587.1 DUF2213 domain-containing protein [Methylobacterium brachiatum]
MLLSVDTKVRLALDRAAVQESFRTKDNDGHLHISATPISKSNVCPYFGREIINWRALGLDADRVYKLYRDPEELEKAASTFSGKPLMMGHWESDADNHDHLNTVGGTRDVYWKAPYLMTALDVWPGPAITKIESEEAAELSAAYRYRADMTPGRTPEGEVYDGVMRDIDGSHVAFVPRGRAGRDVRAWDAAPITFKEFIMNTAKLSPAAAQTRGALAVYLRPKLAKDAAIDFDPILKGVNTKTFKSSVPAMVLGLMKATKGKLAQDADIEDVAEVIEALAEILPPEAEADVKAAVEGAEGGEVNDDADAAEACIEMCRKLSPEDREKVIAGCQAMGGGEQAQDEKKDKAMDAALIEARIRKATAGMVSKTAMDAEIAKVRADARADAIRETTAHINGIADARRRVAPWVGELAMDFDSVEAVERKACDVLGIAHKGKHSDALMDIISAKPKAGERSREAAPRTAMDAAAAKGFDERFGTSRIGHAA